MLETPEKMLLHKQEDVQRMATENTTHV